MVTDKYNPFVWFELRELYTSVNIRSIEWEASEVLTAERFRAQGIYAGASSMFFPPASIALIVNDRT